MKSWLGELGGLARKAPVDPGEALVFFLVGPPKIGGVPCRCCFLLEDHALSNRVVSSTTHA